MATTEEVKALIADRLLAKYTPTGTDTRNAFQGITTEDWGNITNFLNGKDFEELGRFLWEYRQSYLVTLAATEADNIYADQALSHTEIERLFF